MKNTSVLKSCSITTPLGDMVAVASEENLYLLEFHDKKKLQKEWEKLEKNFKTEITLGYTKALSSIEHELTLYFKGELKNFTTPYLLFGSSFQTKVWKELVNIPFGKTCSYLELAQAIEKPTSFRAAAQANGANQLCIVIPCHRVINANGNVGGYACGLERKTWLLRHEDEQKERKNYSYFSKKASNSM